VAASPAQRSLEEARRRGWRAQVVERRLPHTHTTVDLWGFGDLVAMDGLPGSLLIQATSGSNGASRVRKIREECTEDARRWLEAGNRIVVWAWTKYKVRVAGKLWRVREVEIGLGDL
jgi:hypothetical protein